MRNSVVLLLIVLISPFYTYNTFAQISGFGIPYRDQPSENEKRAIEAGIDWLWEHEYNDAPPAKAWVWAYPVPIDNNGRKWVRGWTGGMSCGNYAILWALAGNRDNALAWLNASQAHNPGQIDLYNTYPDYTIDYAVSAWKHEALSAGGLNLYYYNYSIVRAAILKIMGNHNPPTEMPKPKQERYSGGRSNPDNRH